MKKRIIKLEHLLYINYLNILLLYYILLDLHQIAQHLLMNPLLCMVMEN